MNLLEAYSNFIFRGVIEVLIILSICLFLYKKTNLNEILSKNVNKSFVFIFFIIFVLVQSIDRFQYFYPQNIDFYPFARFAMYQASPNGVELQSYRFCSYQDLDYQDCDEVNLTKIFQTINFPSFNSRMTYLVNNTDQNINEIVAWIDSIKKQNDSMKIISFEKVVLENGIKEYSILHVKHYEK